MAAVAKKHGVSEQTIYTPANVYRERQALTLCGSASALMQSDDVKRLKQLEAENARLKKLVAERDLEIEVIDERSPQKSGERAGSPCPGGICDGQRPVVALGLAATSKHRGSGGLARRGGGSLGICVSIGEGDEGCTGFGTDGGAVG